MNHPSQPIDPDEALAPIFRELGKALYIAQQFETCLLLLLALLNCRDGKIDQHTFAQGFQLHGGKPLGSLAKEFQVKLSVPDSSFQFLKGGVSLRNSVAHGFVMRNTQKFQTADGRAALVDELKDTQYALEQRRLFADEMLTRCVKAIGGDLESLRREAEHTFYADQLAAIVRH